MLLHPVIIYLPVSLVGVLIAVGECTSIDVNFPPNSVPAGQQSALSHLGLESYILTAPRTSIISANKEGIVSLPGKRFSPPFVFSVFLIRGTILGYLAIHLLGLSAGTLVLPPSPSFFRRRQQALADKLTKRRISDAGLKHDKDLDLAGPRQTGKTATELCAYSIVWWSFLGLTKLADFQGQWGEVSRRMVRSPPMSFCSVIN